MKNLHLLAVGAAALVLAACGGSSGSSNSSSTATTSTTSLPVGVTPRIEAIVTHLTSYDTATFNGKTVTWQLQDLNTIQALDQIQFQLVYYTASGSRVVLPTDQWTSSDTAQTFGTLAFNNGNFQAANATSPSPLTVSVIYNNHVYSSVYAVVPRQVRERGLIESYGSTSTTLAGVEVDFYGFEDLSDDTPYAVQMVQDQTEADNNIAGTYTEYVFPTTANNSGLVFLGRTVTQSDGTFRASIPAGTYGFTILNSSLPKGYETKRIFQYRGQFYNTGDLNPLGIAPLPTPKPIVTPPTTALANPLPDPVPTSELPLLSNYYPNGEYLLAFYLNKLPGITAINENPATNGIIELVPNSNTTITPPAN
jgi:hypothetical protein